MRLASVQCDVAFGDPVLNANRVADRMAELSASGVQLAVFPECALTGYAVGSEDAARSIAIEVSAKGIELESFPESISRIRGASIKHGIGAVVGYAALEDGVLRNSALLALPSGKLFRYNKTHLPHIGFDRFAEGGGEIPVFETPWCRLGIAICFDLRHPEVCRLLAIKGADVIALPTNWPTGAERSPEIIAPVRAIENHVHLVTSNRVGDEHGFHFIGLSSIIEAGGRIVQSAGRSAQTCVADLDPLASRNKRRVVIPGEYETTAFESRRPELYDRLVSPIESG